VNPQDYSARTEYRPPGRWYQWGNRLGVLLTSIGLGPRDAVTLAINGRRTGKLRRIPILKTEVDGTDYLVSLSGESQWVRNLRAAEGRARITRRRRRNATIVELPEADRPAIINAYLQAARDRSSVSSYAKQTKFYFGIEPDHSLGDIAAITPHYPVFRIDYDD